MGRSGPLPSWRTLASLLIADDQAIPFPTCLLQVSHMAHVQQVEAAVGQHDAIAQPATGSDMSLQNVERADFVGGRPLGCKEVGSEYRHD